MKREKKNKIHTPARDSTTNANFLEERGLERDFSSAPAQMGITGMNIEIV